ncbi:MAG: transporter substrate-binding domain-containing protein [Ruminococcus sp.]
MKNLKNIISMSSLCIMLAVFLSGCAGSNTVHSIADLDGKIIGVQLDTVGDTYASDINGADVRRYFDGAEAVAELAEGKLDAVIVDVEPAKVYVSNNKNVEILGETSSEEQYAVAVKKGNTELMEKINNALYELRSDGTLDALKANWTGENATKKPYDFQYHDAPTGGQLVMATNATFPPYEFTEDDEVIGFDVDLMKAVCHKLNMELVVKNMDFDLIISDVVKGDSDVGVAGITVTDERLKLVDFSNSYTTATQVVIVRKD